MCKRRVIIGVLILIVPLALPLLFLVGEHVRGRISLAHYQRLLVAKGEKLKPRDLATRLAQGENGAPEVRAAKNELKEGKVLPKHYPPRMRVVPSGRAVVCFREEQWVEDKETFKWDELADDLEANAATLERIRTALQKPVLDNKVDLSLAPNPSFTHLAPAKALTFWFGADCQLALHEGRTREALEDLLAEIQLPRLLAEDRLVISELVRIAIAAVARTDTWEALQADGWTDEDLVRVQQAWASQTFATGMVRGLEGEVVFGIVSFAALRESNQQAADMLYAMEEYLPTADSERPLWEQTLRNLPSGQAVAEFLKRQVYCRVWRFAWLDQDERRSLGLTEDLVALARAGSTNRSFLALEPAINRLRERAEPRGLYNKLRYPGPEATASLSGVISKGMRAETDRSLIICAVALKRYTLRHGALPPSLDVLVPEFLPAVPIDYMDGRPIRYHRDAAGGFVLYSVGANGRDDGGDTALLPDRTNPRMLWDRKDCVWPAPALPGEVLAYRNASLSQ